MRRTSFLFILCTAAFIFAFAASSSANKAALGQSLAAGHRAKKGSICGNPKVNCKTSVTFQSNDLPFRVPANSVIVDTELFYAIILKSVSVTDDNCDVFIPEAERLRTQALFPDHKVFTARCADPENLFYTNVSEKHRIMAVYAGTRLAEAKRFLDAVKATGKFPGAMQYTMKLKKLPEGYLPESLLSKLSPEAQHKLEEKRVTMLERLRKHRSIVKEKGEKGLKAELDKEMQK